MAGLVVHRVNVQIGSGGVEDDLRMKLKDGVVT